MLAVNRRSGVQSVRRAFFVLESLARHGGVARLREIALDVGLNKSTAHNILATLEQLGYVKRRETDVRYCLGDGVKNLARPLGDDMPLRARFRPVLCSLAERFGEAVYLVLLSGDRLAYVDGIEPNREDVTWVGSERPVANSAVGRVFTSLVPGLHGRTTLISSDSSRDQIEADREFVRTRGFALDLESQYSGVNCVAVPVFEASEVCAAIGLKTRALRTPKHQLGEAAWVMIQLVTAAQVRSRGAQ